MWCTFIIFLYIYIYIWKMLNLQHQHNNHTTTPHMRVDPKNVRFTTPIQQLYNNPSHESGSHILKSTLMWGVVVQLLYWCCTRIKSRVDPTHWGPLSCEELLCGCCDGVVYESNPYIYIYGERSLYFLCTIMTQQQDILGCDSMCGPHLNVP